MFGTREMTSAPDESKVDPAVVKADMAYASDMKGLDDAEDTLATSLGKKLKKKERERILIVRDFVRKMGAAYDKILRAVREIAPQIGKTIPANVDLKDLVGALDKLKSAKIHELKLIGFYPGKNDFDKSLYMGHLSDVLSAAGALVSGPGGAAFEKIRAAVTNLEKVISFYTEVMQKRIKGGDAVTGGAETSTSEATLRKMRPFLNSTQYDLDESVRIMKYKSYLGTMRNNLDQAAKEIDSYSSKYDEVLGDAVAFQIDVESAQFKKALAIAEGMPADSDSDKDGKKLAIMRIHDLQKAQVSMYRIAQAIDLSMKHFTREAVKNPDAVVRDVKRALDDVEIIRTWYKPAELTTVFDNIKTHMERKSAPTSDNYVELKSHVTRAIRSVQALKNIINVFARIGSKFDSFMTPSEIYQGLVNYMVITSIAISDMKGSPLLLRPAGAFDTLPGVDLLQSSILYGKVLESMVTKVMTVLGMFDMIERPTPLGGFTPVRTILGAAERLEIIPEASDMYYHLPRMAEFYHSVFGHTTTTFHETKKMLTLVPDMDGTFGPLIKLYFDTFRKQYGDDGIIDQFGSYGLDAVQEIVRTINQIYNTFKDQSDPLRAACLAFVAEINRRYGVVTKAQWDKMRELYDNYETSADSFTLGPQNTTDIAILPGEGALDPPVGMGAPSDAFVTLSVPGTEKSSSKPYKHKYSLSKDYEKMVNDLRTSLESEIKGLEYRDTMSKFEGPDIKRMLSSASDRIARASSEEKKLDVVIDLINTKSGVIGETIEGVWMEKLMFVLTATTAGAVVEHLMKVGTKFVDLMDAGAAGAVFEFLLLHSDLFNISVGRAGPVAIRIDYSQLTKKLEEMYAVLGGFAARFRPLMTDTDVETVTSQLTDVREYIHTKLKGKKLDPRASGAHAEYIQTKINEWVKGLTPARLQLSSLSIFTLTREYGGEIPSTLEILFTSDQTTDEKGKVKFTDDVAVDASKSGVWTNSYAQMSEVNYVWSLNRILALMIMAGFDETSKKIYSGLVRDFASGGVFANAVRESSNPDMLGSFKYSYSDGAVEFNNGNILFKSVAMAIKHLALDQKQDGTPVRMTETLADVPEIIKERMKRWFPLLIFQVQTIRDNIKFYRKLDAGILGSTVENLATACTEVHEVLSRVYGELGDHPVYFETSPGAFKKYEDRNGKKPLVTHMYAIDLDQLFIATEIDTPEFKEALYGFRELFIGDGSMAKAKEFLENYRGRAKPDSSSYNKVVDSVIGMARMSARNTVCGGVKTVDRNNSIRDSLSIVKGASHSKYLKDGLSGIEFRTDPPKLPTGTVLPHGPKVLRNMDRLSSLVALNIVPINVHAMMRGIPFANLHNYSFTYHTLRRTYATAPAWSDDSLAVPISRHPMFTRTLLRSFVIDSADKLDWLRGHLKKILTVDRRVIVPTHALIAPGFADPDDSRAHAVEKDWREAEKARREAEAARRTAEAAERARRAAAAADEDGDFDA